MADLQLLGRRTPGIGRREIALCAALLAGIANAGCEHVDPQAVLKVKDVETYWVLDPSRTEKRFLAAAIRFKVTNTSSEELISVDSTAAFRRDGVADPWGSGFFRLTEGRKTLKPGSTTTVTMSSDARYTLEGEPETVFTNPGFKPVNVTFFLKVGSSEWSEFGKASVENVIGSKDARAMLAQSASGPGYVPAGTAAGKASPSPKP